MDLVGQEASSSMIFCIVQSHTEPGSGASMPCCLLHAGRVWLMFGVLQIHQDPTLSFSGTQQATRCDVER
jgi:hypothetical protein